MSFNKMKSLLLASSPKRPDEKVGNKEDIEYGAYLTVSASSVNQLRQRRQVVLNYLMIWVLKLLKLRKWSIPLSRPYSMVKPPGKENPYLDIWSQSVGSYSCPYQYVLRETVSVGISAEWITDRSLGYYR